MLKNIIILKQLNIFLFNLLWGQVVNLKYFTEFYHIWQKLALVSHLITVIEAWKLEDLSCSSCLTLFSLATRYFLSRITCDLNFVAIVFCLHKIALNSSKQNNALWEQCICLSNTHSLY